MKFKILLILFTIAVAIKYATIETPENFENPILFKTTVLFTSTLYSLIHYAAKFNVIESESRFIRDITEHLTYLKTPKIDNIRVKN
jgi:hypothetical protein